MLREVGLRGSTQRYSGLYQDEEVEFHFKCIGKPLEGCMVGSPVI